MQGSTPQHYTIADFLKWHEDGELQLNPKFQRGAVWPTSSRTYLVDSLLRGYPIPKILLRTIVDRDSRRTVRDVVDGQQRLKTIIDFAGNRFALGPKAAEYSGKRYADLEDEDKDGFLSYKITCEQLINASDEDVLEVFVRINSNAVPVTEPELRNARFENEFSDLVKSIVKSVPEVWSLGVLSNRDRVRMADQSLIAEVLGFFIHGVTDGGEARITRLYEEQRTATRQELPAADAVIPTLGIAASLLSDLKGEPIVQRPHFLMLVAAVMYSGGILKPSRLTFDEVPPRTDLMADVERAKSSLIVLNAALGAESVEDGFEQFREARTTTQRLRSRQARFNYMCRALAGEFA